MADRWRVFHPVGEECPCAGPPCPGPLQFGQPCEPSRSTSRGCQRVRSRTVLTLLLLLRPWPGIGAAPTAAVAKPVGDNRALPYVEVPIARTTLGHNAWQQFLQ